MDRSLPDPSAAPPVPRGDGFQAQAVTLACTLAIQVVATARPIEPVDQPLRLDGERHRSRFQMQAPHPERNSVTSGQRHHPTCTPRNKANARADI